jgi:transposase
VAVPGVVCAPGNPGYRGAVDALVIRRGELEREIAELPLSPLARTAKRLMCMRCIDTLTAAVLCAEIAGFERFRHPEQPMTYLEAIHRDL